LKPFRIARVEPLVAKHALPETLRELKLRALELLPLPTNDSCDSMHKLRKGLEQMDEDETVCDIIAFHFLRHKAGLRALLEEVCPLRRYERLISELEKAQD
jgi:hypothetical protein